ncbi:MAG TPA: extracellular solute-binding protein [Candidatus Angelobacter sp.]|nr:extracellular solute-binding protein [Candidatus Angelobacter sp.]
MKEENNNLTRRQLLLGAGCLAAGVATAGLSVHPLAAELSVLEVAYAGSMGSMMEGPLKASVAQNLKLDMRGRAQGSNALAQLIVGGSIRPDVFIPVTPGPMLIVLQAGKSETAMPVARTEIVIAYSPKSRFAPPLAEAAKGTRNWWEILQEPKLRFGRTDPVTDPQGRNIIFTLMLAAKRYKQPDLVAKILGPVINEKQIFTEPTVQARLQSGELDAASAYKVQPGPFNIPYISLPKEINLSAQNVHAEHPDVVLTLGGKTYSPEPLIYYAAALKGTPNSKGATAFVEWLKSDVAQEIFRHSYYDPPGDASALHA